MWSGDYQDLGVNVLNTSIPTAATLVQAPLPLAPRRHPDPSSNPVNHGNTRIWMPAFPRHFANQWKYKDESNTPFLSGQLFTEGDNPGNHILFMRQVL